MSTRHVVILGRQPELSLAELEAAFGRERVSPIIADIAEVETDYFDVQQFGGAIKAGKRIDRLETTDWKRIHDEIRHRYGAKWQFSSHKQTFAISVYGENIAAKKITALELSIKSELKKFDVSARIVPHAEPVVPSATAHHNKLGLSDTKTEIMLIIGTSDTILAESVGAQNITALAARDQNRPKTDAFVGMLPPKLALMMVNMAHPKPGARILDPFCGTGVILQEAAILGYRAYGTDLSEKMIDYSTQNMQWLRDKFHLETSVDIHYGDAIETTWQTPIDAVVAETYLGQPFSAPPSPAKLVEVRRLCDYLLEKFLRNLAPQLEKNTPLTLAVPAWRDKNGDFTFLELTRNLEKLGFEFRDFQHVDIRRLAYFRENQVVARQLLLLKKR